jgi:hypothetical protein
MSMKRARLDPERITRPIQLAAAWFATLVLVEGGLLATATQLDRPDWAPGLLIVAAVVLPVGAGVAAYLLQTRYRSELLADPYYSEIARTKEECFRGFRPIEPATSSPLRLEATPTETSGGKPRAGTSTSATVVFS